MSEQSGNAAPSPAAVPPAALAEPADSSSGAGPGGSARAAERPDADTAESTRPTDEQIVAQENQIKAESAAVPLIGATQSLDTLLEEYAAGNEVFCQKIRALKRDHMGMRRTRGDGNCFFRSFLFGYLEWLVTARRTGDGQKLLGALGEWKGKLEAMGYHAMVFEDAQALLEDLIEKIIAPTAMSVSELELRLADENSSNYIIMYLRFITACEVLRREEHFLPFILGLHDGVLDARDFCQRAVEPMGEESDHIHIVALTDALQIPIRIMYLDSGGVFVPVGNDADAAGAVSHHDFIPEGCSPGAHPVVTLLYRPGHYDLLYAKGG